jgi:hypothetical protein
VLHGDVRHRRRGELAGLPVEHPEGDAVTADTRGEAPLRLDEGLQSVEGVRQTDGDVEAAAWIERGIVRPVPRRPAATEGKEGQEEHEAREGDHGAGRYLESERP